MRALTLSPSNDALLASAGKDGFLNLWDLAAGKLLASVERGDFAFQVAAFAPDGKTLATGGIQRQVQLFKVSELLKAAPR